MYSNTMQTVQDSLHTTYIANRQNDKHSPCLSPADIHKYLLNIRRLYCIASVWHIWTKITGFGKAQEIVEKYIFHDDVIKWKHFPRYWPFVRGIHRWPVTRSFDVFFDLHLNKRLSKQSRRWWFETPPRPLWRHCDVWLWRNSVWCILSKWTDHQGNRVGY